jgi:hypothetical protein
MKKPSGEVGEIIKGLEWICVNMLESTILGYILVISGIFSEGKGTQAHQSRKHFLVEI